MTDDPAVPDEIEAKVSAASQHNEELTPEDDELVPQFKPMTREEKREVFEENTRYWLDMSGEEFLRKWRNREFSDIDNHPNHLRIMHVVFLLPLVGENPYDR